MIIPVRVPATVHLHTIGGTRTLTPNHPLHHTDCPACDGPLADTPITLVCIGAHPDDRKPDGWMTGSAVAVHAACAGLD